MKRLHRLMMEFRGARVTIATPGQVALIEGSAYLVTSNGLHRLPIYPTIKKHN